MAPRITCERVENYISVDLAVGRIRGGERREHRTVDRGCAVRPGQSLGEVPQNFARLLTGRGNTISEDLVAGKLDVDSVYRNQYRRIQRRDYIDSVELM